MADEEQSKHLLSALTEEEERQHKPSLSALMEEEDLQRKHSLSAFLEEEQDEINDSPVEEVKLTVPITDDRTLPVLAFRTWVIGLTSCIPVAFLSRLFTYCQNQVPITTEAIQILILIIGKLLEATLPTRSFRILGTRWTFSMNPSPFNVKEHALIDVFVNSSLSSPTPAGFITIMKVFYHRKSSLATAMLLGQTSQRMGYGYAGLFMKFLVDSPKMWWPSATSVPLQYNVSHIFDQRSFTLDQEKYKKYSKVYPSTVNAWSYGFSYVLSAAALTHTVLLPRRSVWKQFKETYSRQHEGNVHNRLMKSYRTVRQWWFYSILFLSSVVAILMRIFIPQLQLFVWGFLVALITIVTVTLSSGVFYATAN